MKVVPALRLLVVALLCLFAAACPENPGDECPTAACGPRLGMPNTLCPDGKTVAGPTGRCLKSPSGACGWEVVTCP